jgi:uncharacterized protein YqjF (DUF2071 family)
VSTRGHLDETLPLEPPVEVDRPTMLQRWSNLSFVHWPFDAAQVASLLPTGLEVDTFDGAAWIGLIPFHLRIRRAGVPYLPWLASFPETNLRTYVVGPDGRRGIWFLSLDAARLGAVVAARHSYRLPYMWARAEMHRRGDLLRYRGCRRWPEPGADYDVSVDVGPPVRDVDPFQRFVTARWHLFSPARLTLPLSRIGLTRTTVAHQSWPLYAARVQHLEETLLAAAGLPAPSVEPVALFSPGVDTRFGTRVTLAA